MKTPSLTALAVCLCLTAKAHGEGNPMGASQTKGNQSASSTKDANTASPKAEATAKKLVAPKPDDNFEEKPLHEYEVFKAMLKRNNELRKSRNLKPHELNPELVKAAQDHAWYMARTGNFSHYSNLGPQGRARKYGFNAYVRENIGWGYNNIGRVFSGWRNSGAHWSAIVSNTKCAGFGYAISNNGNPYWVAVYGNPPADMGAEEETASADSPGNYTFVVFTADEIPSSMFNEDSLGR